MLDRRNRGFLSESAVIRFMEQNGFTLIVRNFSVHNVGELDAVMVRGDTVAVIEVKSRLSFDGDYSVSDIIPKSKLSKIQKTTRILIGKYGLWDCNIVFLAGLVTHGKDGSVTKIDVIPM
ncbi:MAG: YraN family protein [Clostridiales bacterium]|nr:YraN family protein [Clostridiales bacterium]